MYNSKPSFKKLAGVWGMKVVLVERGDSERSVIVPIDEFVRVIVNKTGWSSEELKSKDMGQVESRLNITARRPNNIMSIKKGKSFSDLYAFIEPNKKQKMLKMIDSIIKQ